MAKRIYNQQGLFGPLYAYLVVISPPEDILRSISNLKLQMNRIADIGDKNLHSKGHITLTDKLTDDSDFHLTVTALLSGKPAFDIRLGGHGFFDHRPRKTIFLHVEHQQPFLDLMLALKKTSGFAHLAIAKKLPPATFEALRPWLSDLDYSAQWRCEEIVVLRKLMSEKHLGFREQFKIPLG